MMPRKINTTLAIIDRYISRCPDINSVNMTVELSELLGVGTLTAQRNIEMLGVVNRMDMERPGIKDAILNERVRVMDADLRRLIGSGQKAIREAADLILEKSGFPLEDKEPEPAPEPDPEPNHETGDLWCPVSQERCRPDCVFWHDGGFCKIEATMYHVQAHFSTPDTKPEPPKDTYIEFKAAKALTGLDREALRNLCTSGRVRFIKMGKDGTAGWLVHLEDLLRERDVKIMKVGE